MSVIRAIAVLLILPALINWPLMLMALPQPADATISYGQDKPAAKGDAKLADQIQPPQTSTQMLKVPPAFGLEDGTPVKLRITRTISSANAEVSDRVDFEALEEIKVGEVIIVPRGGIAWGTVTEAQPKRRLGRGGKLSVNIDAVRLASGEKAALRAVKEVKGDGRVGAMTGAIVAASLLFFPAAPFILFVRGKDVTIYRGTEITAYINGDISLDPAKFVTRHVRPISAPHETTTGTMESSLIVIKSTPDGAEITIDGKLVGSAPSIIRLAPGDHLIAIEKSGFKLWQRTMTVSANGHITVEATLEK